MEKLVKKYIKTSSPKILHKLRIECRKNLSILQTKGLINTGYQTILKTSSKLRDIDVMLKICKDKEIRKILKKKRKKMNKKVIKTFKNIEFKQIQLEEEKINLDLKGCKELLKVSFLQKDDKELHKIRLKIKACRYTNKEYEKEFKKLQDALGKAHDYYKCSKLLLKYKKDLLNADLKKKKFIEKAEEIRKELLSNYKGIK